jgi:hypothetical protein
VRYPDWWKGDKWKKSEEKYKGVATIISAVGNISATKLMPNTSDDALEVHLGEAS